jgi:Caspase domain
MAERLRRRGGLCAAILLNAALFAGSKLAMGAASAAPSDPLDPASTYVLAIGSCLPWLPQKVCRHDVAQFTDAVQELMGVPPGQITTLVDEQATAPRVREAFAKLKGAMPPDSTIIVYYIGHGMLLPDWSDTASEGHEETLLLWSASFPFAALYAVQAGIWLTGSELARLIEALPAESTVVILDTCEASGADGAIVSNPLRATSKAIAVMASSRAHEIAFADLTSAVFTRNLVEAMRSGVPTLYDAFLLAQRETAAEAELRCEAAAVSGSEECTPQDPDLTDPSGIAKRIRLRVE